MNRWDKMILKISEFLTISNYIHFILNSRFKTFVLLDFEAAPHWWLHCMFSIVFYVLCSSLCLWQILWSYQNKVLQLPCGITAKEHNRTTTLVIILENNRRIMNNSYGLHYISRRTNTRSECQGRKITTLGKFDKTSKQSTR